MRHEQTSPWEEKEYVKYLNHERHDMGLRGVLAFMVTSLNQFFARVLGQRSFFITKAIRRKGIVG